MREMKLDEIIVGWRKNEIGEFFILNEKILGIIKNLISLLRSAHVGLYVSEIMLEPCVEHRS